MKFELMVALRFLKESKGQTLLIMAGIIIGVSVQIFLSVLIGGLQKDLINSTVGDSPHIFISASENRPFSFITTGEGGVVVSKVTESRTLRNIISYNQILEDLNKDTRFSAVSPVVNQQAFVTRGGVQSTVSVKGIEIDNGDKIYKITQRLLEKEGELTGNNIYIGIGLSESTGLEMNSILELRSSLGSTAFYKVSGIFDFENQQLNDALVFMNLASAQSFFQMDGMISHIEMQIPQVFEAESITRDLSKNYPDYKLVSWQENNQQLLTALNSQSSSSYVIQFFVILAITLGIASVLAINVVQKGKQIGILKAMGATGGQASRIFILQGALLGFIGSLFGVVFGIALLEGFIIGTRSPGGDDLFPLTIEPGVLLFSVAIATSASIIAAAIPARKAALLDPIEVIRNG
ncbi:MAG: ABC transporter permease [Eubacteriales bacterium]|nr:ABC transporter permease [Eubacteriales bacterium]